MNKLNLSITFILLFFIRNSFSQTRIEISYDASGNRISKKITGNMPNFIVDAFNKDVWVGQTANIFGANCTSGNISWSNGQTGVVNSFISVTPNASTNFAATCVTAGCPNNPIKRFITIIVKTCIENGLLTNNSYDNFSSGNVTVQVAKKIDATNKISGGNINYGAGQTMEFRPGFEVKAGTNFKAEIKGCPQN